MTSIISCGVVLVCGRVVWASDMAVQNSASTATPIRVLRLEVARLGFIFCSDGCNARTNLLLCLDRTCAKRADKAADASRREAHHETSGSSFCQSHIKPILV